MATFTHEHAVKERASLDETGRGEDRVVATDGCAMAERSRAHGQVIGEGVVLEHARVHDTAELIVLQVPEGLNLQASRFIAHVDGDAVSVCRILYLCYYHKVSHSGR